MLKNLLGKKEIAGFNAVIEGTYHDEWTTLNYKLTNLTIPENVGIIKDGTYKYDFFGKTQDFNSIARGQQVGSLEIKIGSLSFGSGIVLPFRGGIPNILERPRAISFKDGRIFIEEHMVADEKYAGTVQQILQTARRLFEDRETNENYKKIMAQYNFGKEQLGGFTVYHS